MSATCETCRWWDRNFNSNLSGCCRRYPPSGVKGYQPDGLRPRGDFPTAHQFDWCGEHQPKEPTP